MSKHATIKVDIEITREASSYSATIGNLTCSARREADAVVKLKQALASLTTNLCPAPEVMIADGGDVVFVLYIESPGRWAYSITRKSGGYPCVILLGNDRLQARAAMLEHAAEIHDDPRA